MNYAARQRLEVERLARDWVVSPTGDNKRDLAPQLILLMIGVLRRDNGQDLAKDQIAKAIKALWRDDQELASMHISLALQPFAHSPGRITWDELGDAARKLERRRPEDDPFAQE